MVADRVCVTGRVVVMVVLCGKPYNFVVVACDGVAVTVTVCAVEADLSRRCSACRLHRNIWTSFPSKDSCSPSLAR